MLSVSVYDQWVLPPYAPRLLLNDGLYLAPELKMYFN